MSPPFLLLKIVLVLVGSVALAIVLYREYLRWVFQRWILEVFSKIRD